MTLFSEGGQAVLCTLGLALTECSPGCGKASRDAVQELRPGLSSNLPLSAAFLHHFADMTLPAKDCC